MTNHESSRSLKLRRPANRWSGDVVMAIGLTLAALIFLAYGLVIGDNKTDLAKVRQSVHMPAGK